LEITSLIINKCSFFGNYGRIEGGAILLRTSYIAHTMISRSHFSFNTNAIFVNNSPRLMLEIENCSFRYNIA